MVSACFWILLTYRPSTCCVVDIPKPSRLFLSMITWVLSVEVAVLDDRGRQIILFVEEISVYIFRLYRLVVIVSQWVESFILVSNSSPTNILYPHPPFTLALLLLCNLRWSFLLFLRRILIWNSLPFPTFYCRLWMFPFQAISSFLQLREQLMRLSCRFCLCNQSH